MSLVPRYRAQLCKKWCAVAFGYIEVLRSFPRRDADRSNAFLRWLSWRKAGSGGTSVKCILTSISDQLGHGVPGPRFRASVTRFVPDDRGKSADCLQKEQEPKSRACRGSRI